MSIETMFDEKPARNPPRIDEVSAIASRGPWPTKSKGELHVLFALPKEQADAMTDYDPAELQHLPKDIRGLRSYTVRGIPQGSVGGNEIHRVRKELVFATEGAFDVECEDAYGAKKTVRIDQKQGVLIPPFIYHTYKALTPGSLLVVCNTLFDPDDAQTHDSYGPDGFKKLQAFYK